MSTSHLSSTDHATPVAHNAADLLDSESFAALRAEIEELKTEQPQDFYAPRFTALAVERLLDTIDVLNARPVPTTGQRISGLLGVA